MSALYPYLILAATVGTVAATAMFGSESVPESQPSPARPQIGEPAAPGSVHLIERPGLYGVSDPAPGMQYAVVGSSLVRIDMATNIVRSVIRGGVRPVD